MKSPVRKPGFGEQLWKKGAPVAAFAGAVLLLNTVQNHIVTNNRAELDSCQKYTFESQRNDCITETGDKNIWLMYGMLGAEVIALGGTALTAKLAVDSLNWKPNRPKR